MKDWVTAVVVVLMIVTMGVGIAVMAHETALSLCWGKYNTPKCQERFEVDKALVYKRDMEKRS